MDQKPSLLGILDIFVYLLQLDPFLYVVQNLLVPALEAGDYKAAARFLHKAHRIKIQGVGPGVAQPFKPLLKPRLYQKLRYLPHSCLVYGKGVILDNHLFHIGEILGNVLELLHHALGAPGPEGVAVHNLRIDAEGAAAGTSPACEYLYRRICGSRKEVISLIKVLFYELGSKGDIIHISDMGHRVGPGKAAICMEAESPNLFDRSSLIHSISKFPDGVVKLPYGNCINLVIIF